MVGLGEFLSVAVVAVVAVWNVHIWKKEAQDPSYKASSEYRRLTLAAIGSPLIVIGVFWSVGRPNPLLYLRG